MAAPDLPGASSGACFGAALAILQGRSSFVITLYAFFFSLLTVLLVFVFFGGSLFTGRMKSDSTL